jgi:hypothetical protein
MIYCATKKLDEYTEQTRHGVNGLYYNYGHDPYLFCLMSRCCSGFFLYEEGFEDIPEGKRLAILHDIKLYRDTVESHINKVPMRKLLEDTTPRELTDIVWKNKPKHLPLCELYTADPKRPNAQLEALWLNFYLRTLQFEKHYRGKIRRNGRVISVVFSSRLSPEEEGFLAKQKVAYKAMAKKVLKW